MQQSVRAKGSAASAGRRSLRAAHRLAIVPEVVMSRAAVSACAKDPTMAEQAMPPVPCAHEPVPPFASSTVGHVAGELRPAPGEEDQQDPQAWHLLREVQRRAIVPDLSTYCAAGSACERGQQCLQAPPFLRAMQRQRAGCVHVLCGRPCG